MSEYPKLDELKTWSPAIEEKITSKWRKAGSPFNPKTKKKIYSIDTPPPYVNSPIHIGHATTYAFMDMFARFKRMQGFEVLFPLGMDRNGLPIELAAEKKFNVSPFQIGRVAFIEKCKELLEQTSAESADSFSKLGISFNSYEYGNKIGDMYNTDSPEYRTVTQATFINLYKRGLIYQDSRINNWDTKLQTTVADSEIDYKEIQSNFNYVKWKVKETGETIIIGTTRPELICTCGMVIFNPKDKRYQHLLGKTAVSPLFDLEVPIQEHPFAQIDKGSGLVMMCSAGDVTDIQFFREMGIKPKIAITKEGRMNSHAGFLQGLKVREARQKIIEMLKDQQLLEKQVPITHSTPVSERSGAEIEFIEMPEWYLKQQDFVQDVEEITTKINFYSPESKKILDSWLDSVSIDWPISRRRYYATPIPLWHSGEYTAVPNPGEYYEPYSTQPPKSAEVFKAGALVGKVKDFKLTWTGDERVLDTWFDSSISEFVIIKYLDNPEFAKLAYPVSLRPQGKEIVRTWLYYTLLRGFLETKKPAFKDVWIHNHILDEKGRKMSKSLGNGIDPKDIIRDFGSEALRFWAATEGDLSKQDLNCSKEKIKGEIKTLNKLINISKFIKQFDKPSKAKIIEIDQLFIDYIENVTQECLDNYNKYDFHTPSVKLRHFLWDYFASHYIELVKNRAYNQENKFSKSESDSAKYTLYFLLERMIQLLYPIIPQITSTIAEEFKIDLTEFPKLKKVKIDLNIIEKIAEFNSEVWKKKKEANISLREPITGIKIPKSLDFASKDLKACHNLN